jgi:dihydroorotase
MRKNTLSVAGLCVNPEGITKRTIIISTESGLIVEIRDFTDTADIVAKDLIFPGFLDVHTHCREDESGEEVYKEDFITGGNAAINGGVVHIAEMGNNPRPPIDALSYRRKEAIAAKCPVPVTLYAMIGPGTNPITQRRLPYKLCHARTTGKNDLIFFENRKVIEEVARRYVGQDVSHHCEDAEMLKQFAEELTHELRRPPETEVSAIDFAIYLTERIIGRGKICHCSVGMGLHKIVEARKRGIQLYFELAPHHCFYDRSMITDTNRPLMQMNPPLRTHYDRRECISALRGGDGAILATDHAPHDLKRDKLGEKVASGQPHLDTYGPFTTWLMEQRDFTPQQIAKVCSTNPGEWLNRFLGHEYGHGYGRIAPGYMGSLTLIDRCTSFDVRKENLKTKCGWSPFEGTTFPGSVEHTIIKGCVLK